MTSSCDLPFSPRGAGGGERKGAEGLGHACESVCARVCACGFWRWSFRVFAAECVFASVFVVCLCVSV